MTRYVILYIVDVLEMFMSSLCWPDLIFTIHICNVNSYTFCKHLVHALMLYTYVKVLFILSGELKFIPI